MDCSQQQHGGSLRKIESPQDILAGPEWSELASALENLKERSYAGSSTECGKEVSGCESSHARSSIPFLKAPTMQSSGSGDLCQQVGSPASYSSGVSSDRNSSAFTEGLDDPSLSLLMDGNIRAILKKVKVNENVLNRAIQRLGGGDKGLKGLMWYIMMWVKEQNGRESSSSQSLEQLRKPKPALDLCSSSSYPSATSSSMLAVPCDRSSNQGLDRFHSSGGSVHPTSFETSHGVDDFSHLHRIKSRRLMGEPETGTGFKSQGNCPLSTLTSIGNSAAGFPYPKLEVSTMSTMNSPMPHVKCEDGVQQTVSCLQSGVGYQYANNSVVKNKPSPAATTRAARKNRMARQRQSSLQQHVLTANHAATTRLSCGPWAGTPQPGGMTNIGTPHLGSQIPSCVPSTGEGQGRDLDSLVFLLQKELRPSDVGNLGRIVLPKKAAETHLPSLAMREGLSIVMEDFDSCISWNLRYRFWPNNKSRMYLLENTGEFVKMHHLDEGDLLILYKDQQGNFVLRGRKKKMHVEDTRPQVKVAHSLVKVFPEEALPKAEDLLTERLYGGGPSDLCGVSKSEPPELDDDPFLKDVMEGIGFSFSPEYGLMQPLERFPSLYLDYPADEFLTLVPKSEPTS